MRHLRPLCESRRWIEPAAAELAAQHADYSHRTNLQQSFAVMTRSRGDSEAYRADTHFHMTLLQACGNPNYARFDKVVAHILDCRTKCGLMPAKPVTEDEHAEVLRAVLYGDALGARLATLAITEEALTATFGRRALPRWPLLRRTRRGRRSRGGDPPGHPFA
jgi:DNA-binding FadR family transcriptional regulator